MQIRSLNCAPPRYDMALRRARPIVVMPIVSPVIEARVSPPARSIPNSLQANSIPSYRSFNASTDIFDDTPSEIMICSGNAFMARMSLAPTVTAL